MTTQSSTETPTPAELVSRLSLERKAELTSGARLWWTNAAPEIGLEPIKVSDGPNGVRGERFDERDIASCTPCGTALAATWDAGLVSRVGAVVADEARTRGIHVMLGPTMNIHRSPLGGRGFECYSEDPLLNGSIAAGWIAGVQSRGVAATAKHFVCNDAETDRMNVDCIVDERALREIYLVPFELAARAGVWAFMTGYNRVNGAYINRALVTEILKDEWEWDGLAMSDWYALGDTIGWAHGGLDLEMPGPARIFGPSMLEAVRAGEVDEAILDAKVTRLLTLADRVGALNGTGNTNATPLADPAGETLLEATAASFVLLKNESRLLPLKPGLRLAVIGPSADDPAYQGGGSAHVNVRDVPTPLEAIRNAFGGSAEIVYERGCEPRLTLPGLHLLTGELQLDYGDVRETRRASSFIWQEDLPGERVRVSATLTPPETGSYVFSLRGGAECTLRVGGKDVVHFEPGPDKDEGAALFSLVDVRGEAELTAGEPVLIEVEIPLVEDFLNGLTLGCRPPRPADPIGQAARAAADADVAVLIVGTSEDDERENSDRETTALPGVQEELIRRVLQANPDTVVVVNAATAVDMGWAREASTVLYAWYPGEAFGAALVAVLSGDSEPAGRMPITIGRRHEDYAAWNTTPIDGRLEYPESVFVGYRHFDARELEPEFCFGHGLGYGEWAYDAVRVDGLSVEVDVRNTGARSAKEIVQLYVEPPKAHVARPPRELRAFAPVTLGPGERTTVSFELDERAFAYWDGAWRVDPGTYRIIAGRSSRDIRLSEEARVENAGGVLSVRSTTATEKQTEDQ